jgi:superfamily II DNA or RNA helicase
MPGSAQALAGLARSAFVIFDEIHHAGDDKAWGNAVRVAFDGAARRLSISGTPFRSDTQAIPFVNYRLDEAVSDFEYGYGDALRDGGVVRPVYFPRIDGQMEWTAPDGSVLSASFQDALARDQAAHRLRTALSLEGDWLTDVLKAAHDRLMRIRVDQPDAGGLVIATDQEHARGIARLLSQRLRTIAEIVTSDDPTASGRIARFATSSTPWLIAVRMVSEGVDIPRLRVGVYASTTGTELFFRQAVGRFVRWQAGRTSQKAYVFIPDDPRLRSHAFQIADQRRHSLRRREDDDTGVFPGAGEDDTAAGELDALGDPEQLSLFSVLSAVVTDITTHTVEQSGVVFEFDDDPDPTEPVFTDDPTLLVELPDLPGLGGGMSGLGAMGGLAPGHGLTRTEQKNRLREANAELARALVARTGMQHAQVNAEMNRLAGIGKVSEATLEQLERRLRYGESWYRRAAIT